MENLEGRDTLEDLGADGRIMLKLELVMGIWNSYSSGYGPVTGS
jgi:hypothetical protein